MGVFSKIPSFGKKLARVRASFTVCGLSPRNDIFKYAWGNSVIVSCQLRSNLFYIVTI